MGLFGPKWWHHHGSKMRVSHWDCKAVTIQSSEAKLFIWLKHAGTETPWSVEWTVIHSQTEQATGLARFSSEELQTAFGNNNSVCPQSHSMWLINEYSVEFAFQGKYIRTGNYLNIPCPGTGHDGDPNVSIDLDDEIRKAVGQLVYK